MLRWRTTKHCVGYVLERVMRIELTTSAWKAEVLPLNYTRINNKYNIIILIIKRQQFPTKKYNIDT